MGIPDRSIPYWNVLMRCDKAVPGESILPTGCHFRNYRAGDDLEWAKLETMVGDFPGVEEAAHYFQKQYLGEPEELYRRFLCVETSDGRPAGMVIAWFEQVEKRQIPSLHWLVTDPRETGQGIGTALVRKALARFRELKESPVYLHTQPWSYDAVGIYSNCGFRILERESFGHYENQYLAAVHELRKYMRPAAFQKLIAERIP